MQATHHMSSVVTEEKIMASLVRIVYANTLMKKMAQLKSMSAAAKNPCSPTLLGLINPQIVVSFFS